MKHQSSLLKLAHNNNCNAFYQFYQDTLETDDDKSSDDVKETAGNVKMDADNTQEDSLKGKDFKYCGTLLLLLFRVKVQN